LGYVGRVTPEKRVRFLVDVERALLAVGHSDFSFLVVGEGSERPWLERHLTHGVFPGILRDAQLAEAYAGLDLFLFPSRSDTYGNVIQEAAASGVPSIVTSDGGPKNLVLPGRTGFIAENDEQFIARTLQLAANHRQRREMGMAARENMHGVSWDAAFEMTYSAYRACQRLAATPAQRQTPPVALEARLPGKARVASN
jgi:glycosyltransferase involved in cell wall biosynthesis